MQENGRRIFFWILWNYTAFQDDHAIEQTLTKLPEEINLIHVLNPSAMIQPRVDTESLMLELSLYQGVVENTNKLIDELRKFENSIGRNSEKLRAITESQIHSNMTYLTDLAKGIQEASGLVRLTEFTFAGLEQILEETSPGRFVQYDEFLNTVKNVLPKHKDKHHSTDSPFGEIIEPLYAELVGICAGRPRNVLPISTYEPDLTGYTDAPSINDQRKIGGISMEIKSIADDVGQFLEDLMEPDQLTDLAK